MKVKRIGIASVLVLLVLTAFAYAAEPVRIAFLDSGISLKHLDAAQVADGENFVFPHAIRMTASGMAQQRRVSCSAQRNWE